MTGWQKGIKKEGQNFFINKLLSHNKCYYIAIRF
jgi:hypothetical protein